MIDNIFTKFVLYCNLINRPQAAARSEILEDASEMSIKHADEKMLEKHPARPLRLPFWRPPFSQNA